MQPGTRRSVPDPNTPDRAAWAAHRHLVAPARARPELWRLFVGIGLAIATGVALNAALARILAVVAPDFWKHDLAEAAAPGQTPAALLVILATFGFFTIGVAVAARLVHDRPALTLIGPPRVAWRQFRAVLAALAALAIVVALLPPYGTPLEGQPNPNLAPGTWLALLPLSLVAVLIQTSAEEILFRGYLQQQLAARFASPLVWAGVPSALFALGHYVPAETGENAVFVALWAAVFGLLMADLTARAGSLGPAIAIHFANNVTALLLFSASDSMNGLALYVSPAAAADPALVRAWLPVDFAAMVVAWLAARLVLRR